MAATAQPQQKKTLLMTEGSIWKSILLFSVPLILGNLLQQLYNTADSIIVGNFLGSNAPVSYTHLTLPTTERV